MTEKEIQELIDDRDFAWRSANVFSERNKQLEEENQRLRKALEDLNQFSRSIMEQDIIDKALGEEN
jgi:hypothetical protein